MPETSPTVLMCWIGGTDIRASEGKISGLGPIGQAAEKLDFDHIALISNYAKESSEAYVSWLQGRVRSKITLRITSKAELDSPVNFARIYEIARSHIRDTTNQLGGAPSRTYHLSPGTWAMSASWVLLAKARFPATMLESSWEKGVKVAEIPLNISTDFLPDMLALPDAGLRQRAESGPSQPPPAFSTIHHRSRVMARVIYRAERVAVRNIPVLIEGESGTGKELFARAIHQASPRHNKPFKAVNCGAIPEGLFESELFGHKKGSFTGASRDRNGLFKAASGGTLFLDEIGELHLSAQVKLLRVLQEGEVTPVGGDKAESVDVRIICATHRSLFDDAAVGQFRTDLFYRLAVAVLTLPALRERSGDISLLADVFLGQINDDYQDQPGYEPCSLTAGARNVLKGHRWPGNVRELQNTLQRAALWSERPRIGAADIRDALLTEQQSDSEDGVLNRPIDEGFALQGVLDEVERHYLERAMELADNVKRKAAEMVGLNNHQTLTKRLKKHGL